MCPTAIISHGSAPNTAFNSIQSLQSNSSYPYIKEGDRVPEGETHLNILFVKKCTNRLSIIFTDIWWTFELFGNTAGRGSHFIFSKMRFFRFWVLFMVLGTAFMFLVYNSSSSSSSSSSSINPSFPGTILSDCEACLVGTKNNRKLKEKLVSYNLSNNKKETADNLNVEDYPHSNPVPSSKSNIHSGPIEHGTPLMPFIPKAAPPAPSPPKSTKILTD